MQSISTIMEKDKARTPEALEALRMAYRSFFETDNGQLVLVDLCDYSGWYSVCDVSIGSLGLAEHNAKRTVFARIHNFLNFTREERDQLAEAAKREQVKNNEEGTI